MQETPQQEADHEGLATPQIIQPTASKVYVQEVVGSSPKNNPMSVFLHVYFIVAFVSLLLFPFVADVILSHKNTNRLNQVTTAVQEILGDKVDINKDNIDVRCYQAETTDFGKGTTFCDRRLTFSTFVDEKNKEETSLKYRKIINNLSSEGWGTYSKGYGTPSNMDQKYDLNIDLSFRGNTTCNGNAIYYQKALTPSYSISMDCGWYKAAQSFITRFIILIIVMSVGWRFCQTVFATKGKKPALKAAFIITFLFLFFYGDLATYIFLAFP